MKHNELIHYVDKAMDTISNKVAEVNHASVRSEIKLAILDAYYDGKSQGAKELSEKLQEGIKK